MAREMDAQDHAHWGGIAVKVDERLWNEISEYFPLSGVRRDVADKHRLCRLIILSKILSLIRSDDKTFSLNRQVMDTMHGVGHRKRKIISKYLKRSKYFRLLKKRSRGRSSEIWSVSRIRMIQIVDQNNMNHGMHGCALELDGDRVWWRSRWSENAEVSGSLASWRLQWEFGGVCVNAVVPWSWYRAYGKSFRGACSSLWKEEWQYVGCIEQSVKNCLVHVPSLDDCLKLVRARLALENLQLTQEELQEIETCTAKYWHRSWSEWARDPLLYVHRKRGRLYYGLVNQPRDLRYRYLRWRYNSCLDDAVEVDLSATYWVLLSSRLAASDCKCRLIEALTLGTFYTGLNNAIGGKFACSKELKIAVQKDCLFGRRNFGRSRLFNAMLELYPDLGKFVLWLRRTRKVSGLSDLLMADEGKFFIDVVLPTIVTAGIPALPIHDAIVVPKSASELVRATCLDLAELHFGFRPKFKISQSLASA